MNPFTGKLEWPVPGHVKSILAERRKAPEAIAPGVIEYNSLKGMSNYAIKGGDASGKALIGRSGTGSTLVIGKDGDGEKEF